jgi:hypothetical protein
MSAWNPQTLIRSTVHFCQVSLLSLFITFTATVGMAKSMEDEAAIAKNIETYRSWNEDVWCAGKYELVQSLVTPNYTRHETDGTRVVTAQQCAIEIENFKKGNTEFIYHDHKITKDRVWVRWSVRTDGPDGGIATGRANQVYRLVDGKLSETWMMMHFGAFWPDYSEEDRITQCNFLDLFRDAT